MSRLWILAGAFTVAAATFALAFMLGTWGFGFRRFAQHETRLQRVMQQEPTIDRLTVGLADEGATVLSAPQTAEDVDRAIADHGEARAAELHEKARSWGQLRVFRTGDMVYFVFFDDDGVMRDFTCVGA